MPDADQAIVGAAIADLADRLAVPADEIELVEFARVTWSDGSLGCPEPGVMYTQALVDGTRTVLRHDGSAYAYHGAGDADPALCERPRPPISQPTR